MAAANYRTRAGDTLDAICKAHYGREAAVPEVLEANPKLAELPPVLPAGVSITLPDLGTAATVTAADTVNLWD